MNSEIRETVRSVAQRLRSRLLAIDPASPTAHDAVFAAADELLAGLASLDLVGEVNRLPSSEIWNITGDILDLGRLQHRARFKPRGYAGDFEMLAQICDFWTTDHPLGKLFDEYFQAQAAPQSVRNRTAVVADAIFTEISARRTPLKVVSVGSGPARDVFSAAERLSLAERKRLLVTLLDLDPDALTAAKKSLSARLSSHQVTAIRVNLARLPGRPQDAAHLSGADMIFCTGFFDYLSAVDAARMLRLFFERLSTGGRILVFNFSPANPTRPYMEWIGNWYLTYRTAPEMAAVAENAGIPAGDFKIAEDASGVSVYLDIRKSA